MLYFSKVHNLLQSNEPFFILILGSMKDWSNYWKKGVQCRQNVREDIPYAGFFTQLGHIHRIYHIWLVFTSFDNA